VSALKQLILGLTAIGLATTAFLPDRKTAQVITASGNAVSGAYRSVIKP
jgi:hypothetical protein